MTASPLLRRGLLALGAALVLGACLDDVTGVRPLTFSLEASPTTASVGDSVSFEYEATGTGLAIIFLDYGDATADTLTFDAPLEIGGFLRHAYDSAGTYEVVGIAVANAGQARDTVNVTVN